MVGLNLIALSATAPAVPPTNAVNDKNPAKAIT